MYFSVHKFGFAVGADSAPTAFFAPMRTKNYMLPKLDRKYILDNVSQEEIFAAYFNISLVDIEYALNGKLIYSAVRTADERPSMGFVLRGDGKLVCRDFGGYFWGDCFDAAAFALRLDSRDPHEFMKILVHIAKTFRIHEYTDGHAFSNLLISGRKIQVIDVDPKRAPIIECQFRDWERSDGNYWYGKYGINRDILEEHKCYAIKTVWINNRIIYTYRKDDPCYGYYLGLDDDLPIWKLYFPMRTEYRFIMNGNKVQGAHLIKRVDHGVIIKSMKDVMQLAVFGDSYSLQGIAPASETTLITDTQFAYLYEHWESIYTFSDFDRTGILFGCNMRRLYKTIPIFLTNGRYNTVNFRAKDLSDYVAKFGLKQADKLISKFLEEGERMIEDIDFIVNELKHNYVSDSR